MPFKILCSNVLQHHIYICTTICVKIMTLQKMHSIYHKASFKKKVIRRERINIHCNHTQKAEDKRITPHLHHFFASTKSYKALQDNSNCEKFVDSALKFDFRLKSSWEWKLSTLGNRLNLFVALCFLRPESNKRPFKHISITRIEMHGL